MNFEIDSGVKSLLRSHTTREHEQLERNICRDKMVLQKLVVGIVAELGKRILADGHNRLDIALKHKLPYDTKDMHFATLMDLYQWVIDNQIGQRNLTKEEYDYYIGKEYNLTKQEQGGDRKSGQESKDHFDPLIGNTAATLAEKHGVSEPTVKRNAAFAEAVDKMPEPVKAQVLSGESGISKKQIINGVVPKLCKKCKSLPAPVAGCQECRALRFKQTAPKPDREPGDDTEAEANEKARDKARPKVGSVIWDKKVFDEPFSRLVRAVDQLYKAYGQITANGAVKEDDFYRKMMGHLKTFKLDFDGRQEHLAKCKK